MNNRVFKVILLIIVILVPIACTIGIGVYGFNRYDPQENTDLDIEFKKELMLETDGSTLGRIDLYRQLETYYYQEEPIFLKDVEYEGEKIYTVAIYRSFGVVADPNAGTSEYATRYDMFIYNVNYTKILDELKKQFEDNSLVNEYSDPTFIVNIYPTADLDSENALYSEDGQETNNTLASITMYDVDSTPALKDGKPYYVQRVLIRGNKFSKSIIKAFESGKAYLSIEAQVYKDFTEDEESQRYSKKITTLEGQEFDGFILDVSKFDVEGGDFVKGWRESGVRETLNNAGYNKWIFKKYLWWQSLLALVISSAIMTGFYFAFTYQEPAQTKKRKK